MKIRAIDDLQGIFWRVRPMPAKTPEKAENQSKEGPMNTTVGKSGYRCSTHPNLEINGFSVRNKGCDILD